MPYTGNADFRTTKGNIAPDYHWSGADDAYEQRAQYKAAIESQFSPAKVVRDATRTYNCHAFAHAGRHAWFNAIDQFLKDDYYPFTPGTILVGDILVYAKDGQLTHSAVVTNVVANTVVEARSKWGALSEVVHPPNKVPDVYGPIKYYLRKRPALMTAAADFDATAQTDRIGDLLYSLMSDERRMQLLLASTPQVAQMIAAGFPEVAELQLFGPAAGEALTARLRVTDDDMIITLITALEMLGYSEALPVIAEKITKLTEAATYSLPEHVMLLAFHRLSTIGQADYQTIRQNCIKAAQALMK